MIVAKAAHNALNYYREIRFFKNARSSFKEYMRSLDFQPDEHVLLPAYIGWSAREGSGVFDPVRELGIKYAFYALDDQLHIDLGSLQRALKTHRTRLFVIIHYFGFVDPNYEKAVDLARRHNAGVLEDQAHSLFTDIVGGITGRLGDASIYSLHKMLPMPGGGLLCVNNRSRLPKQSAEEYDHCSALLEYDLNAIAKKRIRNFEVLAQEIEGVHEFITPLRDLRAGEVPQTYPVLIKNASRDALYEALNSAGYGVVSLYHTMIDQISKSDFPGSFSISGQILNLPVHQDADAGDLRSLVEKLIELSRTPGNAHS